MPQNNPPYVTPTTIVDEIRINEVMISQYTAKVAEINAAIAVLVAANVALNIQLKISSPNLPAE